MNSIKRIYIKTFGCQMNVHDAARMVDVLRPHGWVATSDPAEAALIIVNTCSVREKSQAKVLSAVGRYSQLKQRRPGLLLAVAGCVAQQEGRGLLRAAPQLDLVLSPDHIAVLPELVAAAEQGAAPAVRTGFAPAEQHQFLRADVEHCRGPTALVTIQKGCDNACAYCIVPRVRGPEVSRPMAQIIDEIERIVDRGVKEVTLIGQNVNTYRGGSTGRPGDFIELLRRVDGVDGLARLRFTTSHPKDMHPDLAACYAELRTLCPWLHLPVQSGSDHVLRLMGRGYTRQQYLERVGEVRERCGPDLSLGTDLIVGFPGERERDFLETVDLVEEIQYDYAYSFKFSMRPGTTAQQLTADEPPEAEKLRRLKYLQTVIEEHSGARLRRWRGREVELLVEGPSRRGLPQVCGRTPGNHVVNVDGPEPRERIGELVRVRISATGKHSLTGEPLV